LSDGHLIIQGDLLDSNNAVLNNALCLLDVLIACMR